MQLGLKYPFRPEVIAKLPRRIDLPTIVAPRDRFWGQKAICRVHLLLLIDDDNASFPWINGAAA